MARVIQTVSKPAGIGHGGGRSRTATEFDDQVAGWYTDCKDGSYKVITASDQDDLESVYKQVKSAADFAGYGVDRIKSTENGALLVYVRVRDKAVGRGPAKGSKRDPETGKMVAPGTERFDEIAS